MTSQNNNQVPNFRVERGAINEIYDVRSATNALWTCLLQMVRLMVI